MSELNVIFFKDPKAFRKVLLTPFQIDILNLVIEHNVTTSNELKLVSDLCEATLRLQMKALCDKGYLTRKLSKGIKKGNRGEYIYTVSEGIGQKTNKNVSEDVK